MLGNFTKSLQVTLGYEGGYSSIRSDPGNWTGGKVGKGVLKGTKWGIAASSHPNLDIKNLTLDQAGAIYKPQYWDTVNGDRLAAGVDLATFDAGVMSGPSRGLKWLMASVGGPDDQTVKKLCAKRLGFVQSLKTWKTFGKGWASRIAGIEAKGVAWALASAMPPAAVKAKLLEEQSAASKSAGNNAKGAGGIGAAGAGGGADVALNPQHVDLVAGWVIVGLVVATIAVIIVLAIRARNHKLRAEAYAAEAATIGGA